MEEIDFKYECLFIINGEEEHYLYNSCINNEKFLEILEDIKNKNEKLIFNKEEYIYELYTNKIEDKKERYFHLKIKSDNIKDFKKHEEFLRKLRKISNDNKFEVEILRDDLPLYYSKEAYILINKLENHMRKFIKYFLITKLGINWVEESSPKEIEKAIKDKENRDRDRLKRLDFDELGDFLFKKYSKKNISDLQKLINEKEDIEKSELMEFIQKSNWEKYFKQNINCQNEYLKTRWEKLNEHRNNIAHNKTFNEDDLNYVKKTCEEVNNKLAEAFNKIDEIKTEDIDKISMAKVLENQELTSLEKIMAQYEAMQPYYEQQTERIKAIEKMIKNQDLAQFEKVYEAMQPYYEQQARKIIEKYAK